MKSLAMVPMRKPDSSRNINVNTAVYIFQLRFRLNKAYMNRHRLKEHWLTVWALKKELGRL